MLDAPRQGMPVEVRRLDGPQTYDRGTVVYYDRCELWVKLETGCTLPLRRSTDRVRPVQEDDDAGSG